MQRRQRLPRQRPLLPSSTTLEESALSVWVALAYKPWRLLGGPQLFEAIASLSLSRSRREPIMRTSQC